MHLGRPFRPETNAGRCAATIMRSAKALPQPRPILCSTQKDLILLTSCLRLRDQI